MVDSWPTALASGCAVRKTGTGTDRGDADASVVIVADGVWVASS